MLQDFTQNFRAEILATTGWEWLAVVLALGYLLLAVRRNLWCWLAAGVSSTIYVVLTWNKHLYMQALLSVFYVAMAVYGYWEWRHGRDSSGEVAVKNWPRRAHAWAALAIVVATLTNGFLLEINTPDAALPYLDAFVTWSSVLTTYMVAKHILENWLYWVLIDTAAAYLYFSQGLAATGVLFLIYVAIVIHGYRVWLRQTHKHLAHV